jgi:hypothetical protein
LAAYRQNRVKTELSVTKTAPGEFNFSISCRGKEIDIDNLLQINTLAEQSLKERVTTFMKLLDKSSLCVEEFLLKKIQLKSLTIMTMEFTVIYLESLLPMKSTGAFQQVVHAASAVVPFSILSSGRETTKT